MNIIIKGVHMELSEAIETYVNRKLEPIKKFIDEDSKVGVNLDKTSNHHRSGDVFCADITAVTGGQVTRVSAKGNDIYTAVDMAQADLVDALSNKKDKKQTLWKRGAYRIKEFARGLSKKKRK